MVFLSRGSLNKGTLGGISAISSDQFLDMALGHLDVFLGQVTSCFFHLIIHNGQLQSQWIYDSNVIIR